VGGLKVRPSSLITILLNCFKELFLDFIDLVHLVSLEPAFTAFFVIGIVRVELVEQLVGRA
jgi:hypothetical protein